MKNAMLLMKKRIGLKDLCQVQRHYTRGDFSVEGILKILDEWKSSLLSPIHKAMFLKARTIEEFPYFHIRIKSSRGYYTRKCYHLLIVREPHIEQVMRDKSSMTKFFRSGPHWKRRKSMRCNPTTSSSTFRLHMITSIVTNSIRTSLN